MRPDRLPAQILASVLNLAFWWGTAWAASSLIGSSSPLLAYVVFLVIGVFGTSAVINGTIWKVRLPRHKRLLNQ
jgi:F0F1-type ATP synthase assembly protein I